METVTHEDSAWANKKLIASQLNFKDLIQEVEIIEWRPRKNIRPKKCRSFIWPDGFKRDDYSHINIYATVKPVLIGLQIKQTQWCTGRHVSSLRFIRWNDQETLVIADYASDLPSFTFDYWLTIVKMADVEEFLENTVKAEMRKLNA